MFLPYERGTIFILCFIIEKKPPTVKIFRNALIEDRICTRCRIPESYTYGKVITVEMIKRKSN